MKTLITSILFLAAACHLLAREEPVPPTMGAEWLARVKDPKTRVEALFQFEKANADPEETMPSQEEFAARNERTLLFACPQPGHPDAWAILTLFDWQRSEETLVGYDAGVYEPHPLEIERRKQWNAAEQNLPADYKPWLPGQPWLDAVSGFLVDASGKKLGDVFFASPCILADFDADGMLDLMEIERAGLEGESNWDPRIDCISIGPLVTEQPRKGMIFCNYRKDPLNIARSWRFTVRSRGADGLEIVLVPEDRTAAELSFCFQDGKLVEPPDMPAGVFIEMNPEGDSYDAVGRALERHGYELDGIGSDAGWELNAEFPPPPLLGHGAIKFSFPDPGDLPPRETAHLLAGHLFGEYFKSQYEFASLGDPVPPATEGWLERSSDGGCFGDELADVWWFNNGNAERWSQKDVSTFIVTDLNAGRLGHLMATVRELDLLRAVPKNPNAPEADHQRMGGTATSYRIRLKTGAPEITTEFNNCQTSVWQWIGPKYDPDLAGIIATFHLPFPSEDGRSVSIRDIAPVWLDPEKVDGFPPALSRAAILAIRKNRWKDMKPLLEKLYTSLGPLTEDEKRLAAVDTFLLKSKLNSRDDSLAARRKLLNMEREGKELGLKMTGQPGYEFRNAITAALKELEKPLVR